MVKPRQEAGNALLTALFALLLISIALALVAASLQLRMRLVKQEVETVNLVALADAALAETLAHLHADKSFSGVQKHELGQGDLQSEVRLLESREPVFWRYDVVASGRYGGRDRAVRAVVERIFNPQDGTVQVQVRHWERIPAAGRDGSAF